MSAILYDGMVRRGYIKASPGCYEEIRFQYRPPTVKWRSAYFEKLEGKKGVEAQRASMDLACTRLTDWNLRYPAEYPKPDLRGEQVDFGKLFELVDPEVATKITNIVLGFSASDVDPAATTDDQAEQKLLKDAESESRLNAILDERETTRLGN